MKAEPKGENNPPIADGKERVDMCNVVFDDGDASWGVMVRVVRSGHEDAQTALDPETAKRLGANMIRLAEQADEMNTKETLQ